MSQPSLKTRRVLVMAVGFVAALIFRRLAQRDRVPSAAHVVDHQPQDDVGRSNAPQPAPASEASVTTESADESFLNDLLSRMTLVEKVGQLNQLNGDSSALLGDHPEQLAVSTGPCTGPGKASSTSQVTLIKTGQVGSLLNVSSPKVIAAARHLAAQSRLGIPLLFAYDVIHGYKTMFPIPLAMAASFDACSVEKACRVAAIEASAAGLHWTFAPMVDVARDARWGRVMESFGEDAHLTGRLGAAAVHGFQGTGHVRLEESGQDSGGGIDPVERLDIRSALARVDTIAACAKHFAGYGFAEGGRDYAEAAISQQTLQNVVLPPFRECVVAGVATVMNGFNELNDVPVSISPIVRDQLKGRWQFDGVVVSDWDSVGELVAHGVALDLQHAAKLAMCQGSTDMDMEGRAYSAHLAQLVETGAVSKQLLDDSVRRVLRLKQRLGLFNVRKDLTDKVKCVTLTPLHLHCAREVAQKSLVLLKNAPHDSNLSQPVNSQVLGHALEKCLLPLDTTKLKSIAVVGPLANDCDVPLGNWRGLAADSSAVSVLQGVRAHCADTDIHVLHAAGCRVIKGDDLGKFHTKIKLEEDDDTGFPEAIAVAQQAEVVIAVVGEHCYQTGEGRSQTNIQLPALQCRMLKQLLKVNDNVVVVVMNGRPLDLTWLVDCFPAIMLAWFAGSQAGHAVADVLFGSVDASGRLPMSFPRSVGQLPLYYGLKPTGRPWPRGSIFCSGYTDVPPTALFPFGFGLTYSMLSLSSPRLSTHTIPARQLVPGSLNETARVLVTVDITNSSPRPGVAVPQLYVRAICSAVCRPRHTLQGFQRVHLLPGQTRSVVFALGHSHLSIEMQGQSVVEPGDYHVFVAHDSSCQSPSVKLTIA